MTKISLSWWALAETEQQQQQQHGYSVNNTNAESSPFSAACLHSGVELCACHSWRVNVNVLLNKALFPPVDEGESPRSSISTSPSNRGASEDRQTCPGASAPPPPADILLFVSFVFVQLQRKIKHRFELSEVFFCMQLSRQPGFYLGFESEF